LLAGVLLKLGSYVYIRFTLFIRIAFLVYKPHITVLALLGIIYASLTILRQIDLKRIVAYSSISHMNLVTLASLAGNIQTVSGAILLTIGHGLASGGLFACVGSIYDRIKTRNILYLRALNKLMPFLASYFFIFTLANIGFPPTLNFISELLILFSLIEENYPLILFLMIVFILSPIAGFWIYMRIFEGNPNHTPYGNHVLSFSDITLEEAIAITPLVAFLFILGVYPSGLLSFLAAW